MKASPAAIERYGIACADSKAFLDLFDEPAFSAVLEVGAHDERCANILAASDCSVVGVDLRDYDGPEPCNYHHVRGDWCAMDNRWWQNFRGRFDVAFSLSAIEHFGLGTYGEGKPILCYDVLALRYIWDALREGGSCYLTVPYGKEFQRHGNHWRVYDRLTLLTRLVQDFTIETKRFFASGPAGVGNTSFQTGDSLSEEQADAYDGKSAPHVTVLLKMRKTSVIRSTT